MDLTPQQIIKLINNSKSYIEVFTDLSNYNTTFVNYIRMIHPDHCKEEGSKEASSKLLSFKSEIEKGKTHEDDCGKITYFPFYCVIEGEEVPVIRKREIEVIKKRDINTFLNLPSVLYSYGPETDKMTDNLYGI